MYPEKRLRIIHIVPVAYRDYIWWHHSIFTIHSPRTLYGRYMTQGCYVDDAASQEYISTQYGTGWSTDYIQAQKMKWITHTLSLWEVFMSYILSQDVRVTCMMSTNSILAIYRIRRIHGLYIGQWCCRDYIWFKEHIWYIHDPRRACCLYIVPAGNNTYIWSQGAMWSTHGTIFLYGLYM